MFGWLVRLDRWIFGESADYQTAQQANAARFNVKLANSGYRVPTPEEFHQRAEEAIARAELGGKAVEAVRQFVSNMRKDEEHPLQRFYQIDLCCRQHKNVVQKQLSKLVEERQLVVYPSKKRRPMYRKIGCPTPPTKRSRLPWWL